MEPTEISSNLILYPGFGADLAQAHQLLLPMHSGVKVSKWRNSHVQRWLQASWGAKAQLREALGLGPDGRRILVMEGDAADYLANSIWYRAAAGWLHTASRYSCYNDGEFWYDPGLLSTDLLRGYAEVPVQTREGTKTRQMSIGKFLRRYLTLDAGYETSAWYRRTFLNYAAENYGYNLSQDPSNKQPLQLEYYRDTNTDSYKPLAKLGNTELTLGSWADLVITRLLSMVRAPKVRLQLSCNPLDFLFASTHTTSFGSCYTVGHEHWNGCMSYALDEWTFMLSSFGAAPPSEDDGFLPKKEGRLWGYLRPDKGAFFMGRTFGNLHKALVRNVSSLLASELAKQTGAALPWKIVSDSPCYNEDMLENCVKRAWGEVGHRPVYFDREGTIAYYLPSMSSKEGNRPAWTTEMWEMSFPPAICFQCGAALNHGKHGACKNCLGLEEYDEEEESILCARCDEYYPEGETNRVINEVGDRCIMCDDCYEQTIECPECSRRVELSTDHRNADDEPCCEIHGYVECVSCEKFVPPNHCSFVRTTRAYTYSCPVCPDCQPRIVTAACCSHQYLLPEGSNAWDYHCWGSFCDRALLQQPPILDMEANPLAEGVTIQHDLSRQS